MSFLSQITPCTRLFPTLKRDEVAIMQVPSKAKSYKFQLPYQGRKPLVSGNLHYNQAKGISQIDGNASINIQSEPINEYLS